MNESILFLNNLNLQVKFESGRQREEYIAKMCSLFQNNLIKRFNPSILDDQNRKKINAVFCAFATVSAAFYAPLRVTCDPDRNIIWYVIESTYLSIDCAVLPAWRLILRETTLEFSATHTEDFRLEAALTGIFGQP